MMHGLDHWSHWVQDCESRGERYIVVTLIGARGSTPRSSGTKMVVAESLVRGTIGGGELEHRVIARARELLTDEGPAQLLEHYPLGEKLGQCCGGSTSVLYERFVPCAPALYLFGAGHVGKALAPLLATLPLRVHWVDERPRMLPEQVPEGLTTISEDDGLRVIDNAEANAYFVIMTHNHPLDFALVERALARGDAAYVGVIGSDSKARRFRLRLAHRGYGDEAIDSVYCPIGLDAVPGKRPAEIAVSVAAQLIAHYHAHAPQRTEAPATAGLRWRDLSTLAENLEGATSAQLCRNEETNE